MQLSLLSSLLTMAILPLTAILPGVAAGSAAIAMALSHHRRQSAVVIGACALGGLVAGTVAGFLFLATPEAAGHLAGVAMLGAIIAASFWEVIARNRAKAESTSTESD